jgi:hypothetical protein
MFTCKTCGEQAGFTTGAPTQVVFCSCYTDTLIAQRDRLAAENAELRKQVEDWKTGSTHEARYGDEARRELAAANATLDKLSEVFGTDKPLPFCNNCDSYQAEWQDDECISCGGNLDTSSLMLCDIYAILYPTPENENEQ